MKDNKPPLSEEYEFDFSAKVNGVIKYIGKWLYNEGDGAATMLRLRKWVVDHKFPILKDKTVIPIYEAIIADYYKDLRREIDELERRGDNVPMLIAVGYKKKNGQN
jgi:hypothetical protein